MKKKIELEIECQTCGGTGIYKGFAERNGAAVVCHTCKGTGCEKYHFAYTPFTKRSIDPTAKRVFITGYGYCVGTKPITLDNGVFIDFSKEGVSYDEFLSGKMPKHIKQMGCPMIADQGACHDIKGFTDRCNVLDGGYINVISSCRYQPGKSRCWKRFEQATPTS